MAEPDKKTLTTRRNAKAIERLARLVGVAKFVDHSGLAAGAGAAIPFLRAWVSECERTQRERKERRAQAILENLARRLEVLEDADGVPLDLFSEMLTKAIEDDDSRKVPFQCAVIEWIVADKPRPDQSLVRIAMEAVSRLSFPELKSFVTWHRRGFGRLRLERGWNEHMVMVRYNMLGLLTQDNMISPHCVTPMGKVLADKCVDAGYTDHEWEHSLQ